MTYAEAVARLQSLRGGEHAGMRQGLERIEGLLDAVGHPEQRYRLVQVGGTNGKGSVSAMLAAILKSAGQRSLSCTQWRRASYFAGEKSALKRARRIGSIGQ